MENNINKDPNTPNNNTSSSRILAGAIIIFFGILLLANQLDLNIVFPRWLFKWEMILIIIGLFIGGSSGFKNQSSYILIGIGGIFLIDDLFRINFWQVIFPAGIIALGIWLIVKKNHTDPRASDAHFNPQDPFQTKSSDGSKNFDSTSYTQQNYHTYGDGTYDPGEFVNTTAVFSEIKKIITSKEFKGGEMVNVFGGTDLNLMQTDINKPVVINLFQIFAGTKIIVPSNWRVISEVVSVFGEVDDRRFIKGEAIENEKIVYLKGTSIFGGVTIKSH